MQAVVHRQGQAAEPDPEVLAGVEDDEADEDVLSDLAGLLLSEDEEADEEAGDDAVDAERLSVL